MSTDAIVYVIDSQDDEYFEESKAQFHKLLVHPILKNATILIFANKQDLPGAKSINQLIQDYGFDKIKNHIWHIQSCSALKGEGLVTGIKWLSEQLVFRGKNNFPNNPYLINENDAIEENKENKEKNENKDVHITVNEEKDISDTNVNINTDNLDDINKIEVDKKIEENNNIEISTNKNEG